jgi:hypothetical protein
MIEATGSPVALSYLSLLMITQSSNAVVAANL